MITVGLTGGIGSGKTTVAGMFEDLGVPVYNSDKRAKELMNTSQEVVSAIKKLLGEEAYRKDEIDRRYIAKKVFNDDELLGELNAIVHPAVRQHFIEWRTNQNVSYVIQESALIFEIGSQDFYDKIILVTAPENVRIARVLHRDKQTSEKDVKARIDNQLSDNKKMISSHFVIENLDLKITKVKVMEIHHQLLREYQ